MRTPQLDLTPEQAADAEQIFLTLRQASEDEHWRLAQLLASKPESQLLGATEFEVRRRHRCHEIVRQAPSRPPSTGGKGYRGS